MQFNKEYGFLRVKGENDERLYLAPHGPGAYRVIEGQTGAAVFEKPVALEMILDNPDLFYVPVNLDGAEITSITDPNIWREMNAPK